MCAPNSSKCPEYSALIKRANELRDILGIAKCKALLAKVLADQFEAIKSPAPIEKTEKPTPDTSPYPKTPFILRPKANEWTLPTGAESPSNILKKVLHLGSNAHIPAPMSPDNPLLPPFVPNPSVVLPAYPAGAYYYPPPRQRSDSLMDLAGDGKQFICSLSSKRENTRAPTQPKPIAPPNKYSAPPPGLRFIPSQQPHSFPLTVSLLPQTFSVHLLSTLYMRFQHVSAALQNMDSAYASEILKSGTTQPPGPTRWETWMTTEGAAAMSRALREMRKSLDELCGATARAAWIVDTWGEYQDGKYDGMKPSDTGLGSADINGEEIILEKETNKAAKTPIGYAREKNQPTPNGVHQVPASTMGGKVIPALPVNSIRPPPGGSPLIKAAGNVRHSRCASSFSGTKFFMPSQSVGEMTDDSLEQRLGIGDKSQNGSDPKAGR